MRMQLSQPGSGCSRAELLHVHEHPPSSVLKKWLVALLRSSGLPVAGRLAGGLLDADPVVLPTPCMPFFLRLST